MHSSESSNSANTDQSITPDEDLASWIKQAADGSRDHQKRIYELLAARIYRVIRKIVGASDADDVMQDFVIQLFGKLNQFRFESTLETWAHRMAVNQSLQYLRKTNREEQRVHKAALSMQNNLVPENQNQTDDAEVLRLAMESISGEQRALLHMKEIEGLGYEAIASVLGIPEGTVGSRLNKARKDLKTSLLQLGWEA
ncbi:MAG: RNA polymerase sigma factor [Pirellula sp.]|jgi:RNA polymerase sigma-70 factor (ECF subfamily)|nr:RNA polymerase sigma factor [Planctomycetota bacterium]MCU0711240.1 RNA polymerase sigma factor [Pirellula sp.]